MFQAGFRPCAYIPGMKPHQRTRRDYVLLSLANETSARAVAGCAASGPYAAYRDAWLAAEGSAVAP